MKIDKHNYEAYLLDYHEGKLNSDEVNKLFLYVKNHPELNINFDNYIEQPLIPEKIEFLNKQLLKITATGISTKDHLLIASLEGDLQVTEKKQLDQLLKRSAKGRQEQLLYEKARLIVDFNVIYPQKQQLKKRIGQVRWIYPLSIAAAAAICLMIGYWFVAENDTTREHIAIVETPLVKPVNKTNERAVSVQVDLSNKEKPLLAAHHTLKRRTNIQKTPVTLERDQIVLLPNHSLQVIPVNDIIQPAIDFAVYKTQNVPVSEMVKQGEYLNLTEFVVKYIEKKLDIPAITAVLEDKTPHSFWDYATLGINKLAEATGADFKIERRTKPIYSK